MGGNLLAFWGDGYGSSRGDEPPYPQIYATRVAEKYGRKTPHLGYPRDHVSYIVRVPSKTGGVGKFYRPHVALLEKAE